MNDYSYERLREWAEALNRESPLGLGEALLKYADAWAKDRRQLESLNRIILERDAEIGMLRKRLSDLFDAHLSDPAP